MNYKYILSILILLMSTSMFAQTDSRYSQYAMNGLRLNPAYAGSSENLDFTGIYRNQWTGLAESPKQFSLSMHNALGKEKKVGLGFIMEHEQVGIDTRTTLFASYAYKIAFNNGGSISAGLQAGLINFSSALTEIVTPEGGFDSAFSENINSWSPNFGAGIYYQKNDYYMGISVPHLLAYNSESSKDVLHESLALEGNYREYLFTAGLTVDLTKELDLKPSILVRYIPASPPVEIAATAYFVYKKQFWLGASYRSNEIVKPESLSMQFFYQLDNGIKLGYAYDHTFAPIGVYTSGSHEFLIGLDLSAKGK